MPKMTTTAAVAATESTLASKKDKKKAARVLGAAGIKTEPKTKEKNTEVVYPDVKGTIRDSEHPDGSITADVAKALLGWETVTKGGGESLLTDHEGNSIRCTNNMTNRPFGMGDCERLVQEILRRRWSGPSGNGKTVNGEIVIVGKTGTIISGQHRLIAVVLAKQLWEKEKDKYDWKTEPVLETFLALGIDESDEVVNTVDTGKGRSLADVIFRSEYFRDLGASDRKTCARAAEHAVRLLWDRTGVENAFDIYRTHAEALAVLDNHRRLIDCIRHVTTENVENKIGKLLPLGNAAALMYLMMTSKTDPKAYYEAEVRDESLLDFSEEDAASEFWVNVAQGQGRFKHLHDAYTDMMIAAGDNGLSQNERRALVVKAWLAGDKLTRSSLELVYHVDKEDGTKKLEENPTVGGIDKGTTPDDVTILADEDDPDAETEETPTKKSKKHVKLAKNGDVVWVNEKGHDPWQGKMLNTRQSPGGKTIAKIEFEMGGKKKIAELDFEILSLERPAVKASA